MVFLFFAVFSAVGLSVSVAVASSSSSGFFWLVEVSRSSGSTMLSKARFFPSACETALVLVAGMFASVMAVSENSSLVLI